MKKIIITGCPRTGTTALTSLLYRSTNAVVTNEFLFFHPEAKTKKLVLNSINRSLHNKNSHMTRLLKLKGWNIENLKDFFEQKFIDNKIELFGDKAPVYCLKNHTMSHLIDQHNDAYFIFTHRNPCATVYSFLQRSKTEKDDRAMWYTHDPEYAIDNIIKYTNNWLTILYPNIHNKIIINYDTYINKPELLIDKLNMFLDTKLSINKSDMRPSEKLYSHDNYLAFADNLDIKQQDMIFAKYKILQNHINNLMEQDKPYESK